MLWRHVGHREHKRTLSYGEIADLAGTARSSVQASVERYNRKLKEGLDSKSLERLMLTAHGLGLGYNLVYNTLVEHKLVPKREREIDSFDQLDKLI